MFPSWPDITRFRKGGRENWSFSGEWRKRPRLDLNLCLDVTPYPETPQFIQAYDWCAGYRTRSSQNAGPFSAEQSTRVVAGHKARDPAINISGVAYPEM